MFNDFENRSSLKEKKTCYVLLGHEINQETFEPSRSCKLRCKVLSSHIRKYFESNYFVIFMGLGRLQGKCNLSISECMFNYFSNNFFIPDEYIIEKKSVDTVGDAIFSYEIIKAINFNNDIYIISSDWHMRRVKHIFRKIYIDKQKLFFIESKETKFLKKEEINDIFFKEKNSIKLFDNSYLNFNRENQDLIDFLKYKHQFYKGLD